MQKKTATEPSNPVEFIANLGEEGA